MNGAALPDFKRDFVRSVNYRRELERFMKEQERERAKKNDTDDRLEDDIADLAMTVMAGDVEIADFCKRLDSRRAATIESLMENEEKLVRIQKRLDEKLAKAYVLPDGRRVFKTKDGERVFDEHGMEVSADEIDRDLIEDWRPDANGYLIDLQDKRLTYHDSERKLQALERMDEMEDRIAQGNMTQDDLTEMEKELDAITSPDILAREQGIEWTPPSMKGHFDVASGITPAYQSPARTFDQFAPG